MGNVARSGDLRLGLSKSVVERNCPNLDGKVAEKHNGEHNLSSFAHILKQENQVKRHMKRLISILKNEHPDLAERRQFMDCLLKHKGKFDSLEFEAIRRVYRMLYGELPKEG